jgi:Holliday junction resolvase-like predicted endonuclease
MDDQLLRTRYRRRDVESPHAGEHSIEHEILSQLENVRCLDGSVVDGINAMPLARDETGGRRGNVEGDLFLLLKKNGTYHLVICEVKHSANTCWYAAIESLRQLKLLHLSTAARQLFHHRNRDLSLPAEIPIVGLVLAPEQYYIQPGQKGNVLPHTIRLLSEFRNKTGIEAYLAAWDPGLRVIQILRPSGEIGNLQGPVATSL